MINIESFKKYSQETAELYVSLYSFQPMSLTLHKILWHGAEVIKQAILPIGKLSEKAAQGRNKHIRSFRQNYLRKFSPVASNADVLSRLLLTSDPVITRLEMRSLSKKSFCSDVLNLLSESDATNVKMINLNESDDE